MHAKSQIKILEPMMCEVSPTQSINIALALPRSRR